MSGGMRECFTCSECHAEWPPSLPAAVCSSPFLSLGHLHINQHKTHITQHATQNSSQTENNIGILIRLLFNKKNNNDRKCYERISEK